MAESSGGLQAVMPFILGDNFSIIICSVICGSSVIASLIFSWMVGIIVIASFIAGILISTLILRPDSAPVDFLFMLKKPDQVEVDKVLACPVCGSLQCNRHIPDEYSKKKPWSNLRLPREVDEALEKFLNTLIKEHVYSWYRDISNDETFVVELKTIIRYAIASVYSRILKVDVIDVICNKLLKCALSHLDSYVHVKRTNTSDAEIEKCFFEYCQNHIHVACRNRQSEIKYLQQLSEDILELVLPKCTECRTVSTFVRELVSSSVFLPAMDVIADPDNVNNLLLIFFDEEPMVMFPDVDDDVELLESFMSSDASLIHSSTLNTNLQLILNDNQLFFSFMTFLKKEGAVNILQFCMSVEDFNKKILGPDWETQDKKELKDDMTRIYNTFCAEHASEKIHFESQIVQEIAEILSGPDEDMLKFHSSDVMLLAYDRAYHILETVWCQAFYQSSLYFSLICGNKGLVNQKNSSNLHREVKRESSVVSKFGSRLRDVFRTNTIDGHMDRWGFDEPDLAEAVFAADDLDATLTSAMIESTTTLRDLSAWRLSIPRVESRMDIHNKHYYVFIIDVQRIDVGNLNVLGEEISWTIDRKYPEFYVLEAKLTEFHGELHDIHLPPKKLFSTKKSMEFMKKNKAPFEIFLQKLLVQPSLKGSELLYNFLTSREEFTEGFLPDIGFGKMFKTVPMKLRKEKGQNLESFLNSFMLSTEQVKPTQGKLDWKDIFEETAPSVSQKLASSIYGNNADMMDVLSDSSPAKRLKTTKLSGVFDYILYLCSKIFLCPPWFMHLLMAIKVIGKTSLGTFTSWYLERKMNQALKSQRIVLLIELLTEVLFYNEDLERTEEEKLERKKQVYMEARTFLPDILIKLIGDSRVKDGTDIIISGLQHPKLNKQLSYMLLDVIVNELFPEIASAATTSLRSSSH